MWGRSAVDQIRKREMYGKQKKKKEKKGWSSGNRWKVCVCVCGEGGECAFIGTRSDEFPLGHFINAEPTKLSIAKPLPRQTLSTTSRFSSINGKALEPSIPRFALPRFTRLLENSIRATTDYLLAFPSCTRACVERDKPRETHVSSLRNIFLRFTRDSRPKEFLTSPSA